MTEQQVQGQPTPEEETTPEPPKPDAKYTDKDVDKLKGAARKEGKQTAINELLGELEVESVDDIKELIQAFKTVEEESATEADTERKKREKAEAKLQALEEKANQAEEARKQDLIRYELRDALRNENINPERIDLAFKVADTSSVEVEDSKVKGVEAVVKNLKDSSPEWFGNTEPRKPSGFDGVPPGDPNGATQQQKQENQEIAKRQIHRMF